MPSRLVGLIRGRCAVFRDLDTGLQRVGARLVDMSTCLCSCLDDEELECLGIHCKPIQIASLVHLQWWWRRLRVLRKATIRSTAIIWISESLMIATTSFGP
ncbi:hypothetical protein BDR03DRAFT_958241, partial [Suillus americanus]